MKKVLLACVLALLFGGDVKAQCYSGGYNYRPTYYGGGYAPSYSYTPTYTYYGAHWYGGKWFPAGYYYVTNGVYYLKDHGPYYGLSYDPTYTPPPATAVLYPGGTQFVGVPGQAVGLGAAPGFGVGMEPKYSLNELFTINQFSRAVGQQQTAPTVTAGFQQSQATTGGGLTQRQLENLMWLADQAEKMRAQPPQATKPSQP